MTNLPLAASTRTDRIALWRTAVIGIVPVRDVPGKEILINIRSGAISERKAF